MADTLSALVHNKTVPKLIETNNFMIINGNLYHKGNLASTNKKTFSFEAELGNNILHISRSMHLTDNARIDNRFRNPEIKEDKYIENRSYIILNNQYSNVNNTISYLVSFNETDDDIQIIKNISITNAMFIEIISITDNYIFVSTKPISGDGVIYLKCLDKNLNSIKDISIYAENISTGRGENKGNLMPIKEDDNFLYFLTNGYSNVYSYSGAWTYSNNLGYCELNKTNLETKTRELRIQDAFYTWVHYRDFINDFYEINNKFYFLVWKSDETDNNNSPRTGERCFTCKLDLNENINDIFSKEEIYGLENIKYKTTDYNQCGYFIKDNYIYYYIADETNANSNVYNYQGIHKIEITNDFELTYISRTNPIPATRIISILFDKNYETIIVGYYQSFDILVYNDSTKEYQKRGNTYMNIKNVGLDSLNRLWYETTSGEVHTENFDDPQKVEVKFEKPYYSYGKTPIHTYLTFKAKSAAGAVPSGRYTLTITSNNAYFEETGDETLCIEYTNVSQDDIHYPVVITAAKRVVCSISFEKVW